MSVITEVLAGFFIFPPWMCRLRINGSPTQIDLPPRVFEGHTARGALGKSKIPSGSTGNAGYWTYRHFQCSIGGHAGLSRR